MEKRTFGLKIAHKLVAALLVFGLLPAIGIFTVFKIEEGEFKQAFRMPMQRLAESIGDTVDRNLFERYGDVQAFGLNRAAHDAANWRKPAGDNPLVASMNGYMTGYGIYRLMLLLDTKGEVVAVNSVDGKGGKLDTSALDGKNFASRSWFEKALKGEFLQGRNGFTGTAVDQPKSVDFIATLYGDDGFVIPFSAPVRNASGKVIAVWVNFADFGLVEDIIADYYRKLAEDGKKTAELTVLDPTGRVLVDYDPIGQGWTDYKRDPKIIGKFNLAEKVEAARMAIDGKSGSMDALHARKQVWQAAGYTHTAGAYDYPGLGWSVLVRAPVDEVYAATNTVERIMIIAMAVSALLIVLIGLYIGRRSAAPLRAMTDTMTKLAGGDTEVEVPARDRGDEIGEMASAVQVFKDNAIERARLRSEAERDQEERARRQHRVEELIGTFEGDVQSLLEQVTGDAAKMTETAAILSDLADSASARTTSASAGAEEASTNVETVASAAEELASSIAEINEQVTRAMTIVGETNEAARSSNDKISSLSEAASKIGEVVLLIQDIAEQTNLLALNATIEAARAGEMGKGFAVVAAEVKSLANQTAKATEEISSHITAIQGSTDDAVGAIKGITTSVDEVNVYVSAIAAAVEEQGAATSEISRNVQQAAIGTKDVAENMSGINQAASDTSRSAGEVEHAAGSVSARSDDLRTTIARFLKEVAAA